jgi:hypothetical protein
MGLPQQCSIHHVHWHSSVASCTLQRSGMCFDVRNAARCITLTPRGGRAWADGSKGVSTVLKTPRTKAKRT